MRMLVANCVLMSSLTVMFISSVDVVQADWEGATPLYEKAAASFRVRLP